MKPWVHHIMTLSIVGALATLVACQNNDDNENVDVLTASKPVGSKDTLTLNQQSGTQIKLTQLDKGTYTAKSIFAELRSTDNGSKGEFRQALIGENSSKPKCDGKVTSGSQQQPAQQMPPLESRVGQRTSATPPPISEAAQGKELAKSLSLTPIAYGNKLAVDGQKMTFSAMTSNQITVRNNGCDGSLDQNLTGQEINIAKILKENKLDQSGTTPFELGANKGTLTILKTDKGIFFELNTTNPEMSAKVQIVFEKTSEETQVSDRDPQAVEIDLNQSGASTGTGTDAGAGTDEDPEMASESGLAALIAQFEESQEDVNLGKVNESLLVVTPPEDNETMSAENDKEFGANTGESASQSTATDQIYAKIKEGSAAVKRLGLFKAAKQASQNDFGTKPKENVLAVVNILESLNNDTSESTASALRVVFAKALEAKHMEQLDLLPFLIKEKQTSTPVFNSLLRIYPFFGTKIFAGYGEKFSSTPARRSDVLNLMAFHAIAINITDTPESGASYQPKTVALAQGMLKQHLTSGTGEELAGINRNAIQLIRQWRKTSVSLVAGLERYKDMLTKSQAAVEGTSAKEAYQDQLSTVGLALKELKPVITSSPTAPTTTTNTVPSRVE